MTIYTIATTDSPNYNGINDYNTYTTSSIRFDSQKLNSPLTVTSAQMYEVYPQTADAYEYFHNPPKVIELENVSCYLNLITSENLKDKETTLATLRRFIRWGIADLKAYRDADTSIVEDIQLSHLALLETFGYQDPTRCKKVLTDIIKIYRRILFSSAPINGIPNLQPYRLYRYLALYLLGQGVSSVRYFYTFPNSSTISVDGTSISATSFKSNQLS